MFTLSIVFNVHREGDLARKTIKNLRDTFAYSRNHPTWKHIEIIAILDNTNDITRQVISENRDIINRVEEVDYRDLAFSRHHGIRLAKNNFILFADGDDYFSHNTLKVLYEQFFSHYSKQGDVNSLPMQSQIAVYPEWLIDFPKLHFQHYTNSNPFIVANMRFSHCFISRIACPKIIFENRKLRKNEFPYGFEDWDFNNQLLAAGVQFKIAPDYMLYYRTGNQSSMLQTQKKSGCVVRNSELYNTSFMSEDMIKDQNVYTDTLEKRDIVKNKQEFIDERKAFLEQYAETDLIDTPKEKLFDDMEYTSTQFTSFSASFERIVSFLRKKEVVILLSHSDMNQLSNIISKNCSDIDEEKIAAVVMSEKGQPIIKTRIDTLNLNINEDWNVINEDSKIHILLKSLINSPSLKNIYFSESAPINMLPTQYASIFSEFNKTITTF